MSHFREGEIVKATDLGIGSPLELGKFVFVNEGRCSQKMPDSGLVHRIGIALDSDTVLIQPGEVVNIYRPPKSVRYVKSIVERENERT